MIKLNYLALVQKNITFYISVCNVAEIADRINVNRRRADPNNIQYDILNLDQNIKDISEKKIGKGLQRELMKDKVQEISTYLSKEFGLIPNSIILNIEDPLSLVNFGSQIEIPDDESILITALDGQHRIEGLKSFFTDKNEKYEIPLTIFYNTELEFQAFLFSTINSKQTKINKSFLYDLLSLTKTQVDEFKLSHEIAYWLNSSNNSILKNNFKLLGKGEGWLSQAAFIDYLIPNIYLNEKKDTSNVIFKYYIKSKEYNKIAEFINDYFKAIIKVYENEFYSSDYIFKTSFIFGLFMRLMPYTFIYSFNILTKKYDNESLENIISWIKFDNIDFKKGGVNSGTGSSGKQKQLLNALIKIIQDKVDINSQIEKFKVFNNSR